MSSRVSELNALQQAAEYDAQQLRQRNDRLNDQLGQLQRQVSNDDDDDDDVLMMMVMTTTTTYDDRRRTTTTTTDDDDDDDDDGDDKYTR